MKQGGQVVLQAFNLFGGVAGHVISSLYRDLNEVSRENIGVIRNGQGIIGDEKGKYTINFFQIEMPEYGVCIASF